MFYKIIETEDFILLDMITLDFNWVTYFRLFRLLFHTCFIPVTEYILKFTMMLIMLMGLPQFVSLPLLSVTPYPMIFHEAASR